MKKEKVKTAFRQKKEALDLAIYNERKELMAQPGAMATRVDALLMKKYKIYSMSTIFVICKRVENRLSEEQQSQND